jgi:hypothetical protein
VDERDQNAGTMARRGKTKRNGARVLGKIAKRVE